MVAVEWEMEGQVDGLWSSTSEQVLLPGWFSCTLPSQSSALLPPWMLQEMFPASGPAKLGSPIFTLFSISAPMRTQKSLLPLLPIFSSGKDCPVGIKIKSRHLLIWPSSKEFRWMSAQWKTLSGDSGKCAIPPACH